MRGWSVAATLGAGLGLAASANVDATKIREPLVIAHRGASGERPEHTALAYQLAIAQGADFIEPDLVPTRDGHLVVRHENNIASTTDVARRPEFADRRSRKTIDGVEQEGWFTEDFTLAELKSLRAIERLPRLRPGNTDYDGKAEILTFAEAIAIAKEGSAATGRTIGVYPETKHPSYFSSIGLPLEDRLLRALDEAGWNHAEAPVFIQSFEPGNLRALSKRTKVKTILLIAQKGAPADQSYPSYQAMLSADALREVAGFAHGIGPELSLILSPDDQPTPLIEHVHAAGLKVHVWTLRAENFFLPEHYRVDTDPTTTGRLETLIHRLIALGVDGYFTDFPAMGVAARSSYRPE